MRRERRGWGGGPAESWTVLVAAEAVHQQPAGAMDDLIHVPAAVPDE